jgi:DNA-binding CsgD family transcriptional regulator
VDDVPRAKEFYGTTLGLEILQAAARGLSNKEIGRRLYVSEATVKTHLLRVFSKLGVDDRTAAVTPQGRRMARPRCASPAAGSSWSAATASGGDRSIAACLSRPESSPMQMAPRTDLSSTGYALANPGQEHLVLQPGGGGRFTVLLEPGTYAAQWFSIQSRNTVPGRGRPAAERGAVGSSAHRRRGRCRGRRTVTIRRSYGLRGREPSGPVQLPGRRHRHP